VFVDRSMVNSGNLRVHEESTLLSSYKYCDRDGWKSYQTADLQDSIAHLPEKRGRTVICALQMYTLNLFLLLVHPSLWGGLITL
jgi:hypothetical protein